ncbi:MAG TPA: TetR/AcrR family transcriptional regulator [Balneolales bacterium]|nr:TetR/AcrR family transcriptional regulator [Balneolales bacterium]
MPIVEQDIRELILDTTRNLLTRDGYNSLSMRKIAKTAGCGLGTIYIYFENKDVLIHDLIDEGFEKMYLSLRETVEKEKEARLRLAAFIRAYIHFGLQNPEFYEIMYLLHPERMQRYPREKYRRARRSLELLESLIKEVGSKKSGLGKEQLLSYSIWSALHGAVTIILAKRLDNSISREAFIESVISGALSSVE